VDPSHEVTERVVDQTVLVDEAQAGEGRGLHPHVEMVAFPGGIDDCDRGSRQRRRQASLQLLDTHHRRLAIARKELEQARRFPGTVARYFFVQTSAGFTALSHAQVVVAFGWSVSTRNPVSLPVQSVNVTPSDCV